MESVTWTLLRLVLLAPYLTVLAIRDARTRRLPNAWTLGGLAAGIAVQAGGFGVDGVMNAVGGAGICALFLLIPYLVRAAGAGDLKLLAACGAFFGVHGSLTLLVFVSFAGLLVALALLATRKAGLLRFRHWLRVLFDWRYDRRAGAACLPSVESEQGRIPFAVAIALGALGALLMELGG